jgi:hypothetical protein
MHVSSRVPFAGPNPLLGSPGALTMSLPASAGWAIFRTGRAGMPPL